MKSAKTGLKLLGALMVVGAIVPEVRAETATVDGIAWTYTVKNGEASLGGGWSAPAVQTSTTGNITIPSTLDGYPVASIGNHAFHGCSGLTDVTIPNCVTNIGYSAFEDCSGLTCVTIPDSVTSIGDWAFDSCSGLTSMTIPDSVTSIGNYMFYSCSGLTNVTIPAGVTNIGNDAFSHCSGLTNVTIPAGVTNIGNDAFSHCSGLMSLTIPDGVTSIGSWTFYNCSGLTSMTIPDSVTSIGDSAFSSCYSLTNVTISDNVTSIGSWTFSDCSGLTSMTIPGSVTNIGDSAFSSCYSLTNLTISDNVTSIGDHAFSYCSRLTSVTIPDSVTSIGNHAFSSCSGLTGIVVDAHNPSYSSLGGVLFSRDKSTLIVCPGKIQGTYSIPDGVACIEESAFSGCSGLTGVTMPGSVTSIGNYAFSYCSGLTSMTIPDSVISIGNEAFSYCNGLTGIVVDAHNPSYSSLDGVLFSRDKSTLIVFPRQKQGAYAVPDGVVRIEGSAFYGCGGLTSVTMPDSVKSIGTWAFYGCNGLVRVTIPGGVASIGDYTFDGCSGLTSVEIPGSVTSIGNGAFGRCSGLTSMTIPDGVTNIGYSAFYDCFGLAIVTIPSSVTKIESSAFYGCTALENIVVDVQNPSYSSLDGVLFSRNGTTLMVFPAGKLGTYTIPEGVTNIADSAFSGCRRLTGVMIGDGVKRIGYGAFSDCRGLTNVTIGAGATNIASSAFSGCRRLKAFEVADGNAAYASRDGVLFSKDLETLVCWPCGREGVYTIPDGVKSIGSFSGCLGLKSVSVPSSLQSIGHGAFYRCRGMETLFMPLSWKGKSLENSNIPRKCRIIYGTRGSESVDGMEWQFFIQGDSVMVLSAEGSGGVAIPVQLGGYPVADIAPYAFCGCEGLTGVDIPATVTNIGGHAFAGCEGLGGVELPSGIAGIGDYAFAGCRRLTNIVIPGTVQRIGQFAFRGCTGLTGLTMGSGVESIGKHAFAKCSGLASVTIPGSVRTIGDYAFFKCTGLLDLVLANGVERIGSLAFAGCDGLESVAIPASVNQLGEHPFARCKRLPAIAVEADNEDYESRDGVLFSKGKTALVGFPAGRDGVYGLPDEVAEVGRHAFDGCVGLNSLEVGGGNAHFASRDGVLFSKDRTRLLVCPAGKAGVFAVPDGAERIEDRAFAGCTKLTSILIPESVASVGTNSLYQCDGLVALFVPEAWEEARDGKQTLKGAMIQTGWKIFHGRLEVATLDGVEWHFFAEDGGAVVLPGDYGAEVEIPAVLGGRPVTRIGEYAFYGCGELEKVEIPGSVTNVGDYAFYGCEGLESVELPESVRGLGKWAFGGCKGLENIKISEGIESIGDRAFFGCRGLPEAAIPDSVGCIGVNAFYGNSALTALEVGVENANYASRDGVLFSKDMERLLWCPDGKTGEYVIPEGVKSLAYRAFGDCVGLTRGTLPESVEKIGKNAFYGCRGMLVLYVPASWEGDEGWLEMLERAKLPEECLIVYLKDNPEEATSTTPVPVTFEWLEEKAGAILEANGGDYEAAAGATAANGRPVWACYVADLDPTDAGAELRMEWEDGRPVYGPVSGRRVYVLEGSEELGDPEGWSSPTNARQRYFRVRVEVP